MSDEALSANALARRKSAVRTGVLHFGIPIGIAAQTLFVVRSNLLAGRQLLDMVDIVFIAVSGGLVGALMGWGFGWTVWRILGQNRDH